MNKEELKKEARRISSILQDGSCEEVRQLSSPGRNAPLEVRFVGGEIMSVNVNEVGGEFSLCIDGLQKEPEWVSTLGSQFVTRPLG